MGGLNKHSCFQVNAWKAFNYCNYKHAHTALVLMWPRLDIKGPKQQIKAELVGRRCGFLSSHDGGGGGLLVSLYFRSFLLALA